MEKDRKEIAESLDKLKNISKLNVNVGSSSDEQQKLVMDTAAYESSLDMSRLMESLKFPSEIKFPAIWIPTVNCDAGVWVPTEIDGELEYDRLSIFPLNLGSQEDVRIEYVFIPEHLVSILSDYDGIKTKHSEIPFLSITDFDKIISVEVCDSSLQEKLLRFVVGIVLLYGKSYSYWINFVNNNNEILDLIEKNKYVYLSFYVSLMFKHRNDIHPNIIRGIEDTVLAEERICRLKEKAIYLYNNLESVFNGFLEPGTPRKIMIKKVSDLLEMQDQAKTIQDEEDKTELPNSKFNGLSQETKDSLMNIAHMLPRYESIEKDVMARGLAMSMIDVDKEYSEEDRINMFNEAKNFVETNKNGRVLNGAFEFAEKNRANFGKKKETTNEEKRDFVALAKEKPTVCLKQLVDFVEQHGVKFGEQKQNKFINSNGDEFQTGFTDEQKQAVLKSKEIELTMNKTKSKYRNALNEVTSIVHLKRKEKKHSDVSMSKECSEYAKKLGFANWNELSIKYKQEDILAGICWNCSHLEDKEIHTCRECKREGKK